MLDQGLLLSGAVIVAVAWLTARWATPSREANGTPWRPGDTLDVLLGAGMAGLLAGRAAAVMLDDPDSLRSLSAFLVVRGGVEMWPGALVATVVAILTLRRRGATPIVVHLAVMAPVALAAYAGYEATCLVREGCYGPSAPVGLRPDGLDATMVPLGVVVGIILGLVAVLLARRSAWTAWTRIGIAVTSVALARTVASIWLPRIGEELTRQHLESIAVAVVGTVGLAAIHLTGRTAAVR